MLVGLQKMGKTTLLAHLRECSETSSPATTFTQRVGREDAHTAFTRSGSGRRTKGGRQISMLLLYSVQWSSSNLITATSDILTYILGYVLLHQLDLAFRKLGVDGLGISYTLSNLVFCVLQAVVQFLYHTKTENH